MKISDRVRSTDSTSEFGNSANRNPLFEFLILVDTTDIPETLVAAEGIVPVATLVTLATASTSTLVPKGETVFTLL